MPALRIRELTSSPVVDPELLARVIQAAYEVKAEREAHDAAELASPDGSKRVKLDPSPADGAVKPESSSENLAAHG